MTDQNQTSDSWFSAGHPVSNLNASSAPPASAFNNSAYTQNASQMMSIGAPQMGVSNTMAVSKASELNSKLESSGVGNESLAYSNSQMGASKSDLMNLTVQDEQTLSVSAFDNSQKRGLATSQKREPDTLGRSAVSNGLSRGSGLESSISDNLSRAPYQQLGQSLGLSGGGATQNNVNYTQDSWFASPGAPDRSQNVDASNFLQNSNVSGQLSLKKQNTSARERSQQMSYSQMLQNRNLDLPLFDASLEFNYTAEAHFIVSQLKQIHADIVHYHQKGDKISRDEILIEFVQIANESIQILDLSKKNEQDSAFRILENCTHLINEIRAFEPENLLYQDFLHDCYNNMARVGNARGDISMSLDYLLMALDQVKEWDQNAQKIEEITQVTILPELYMNICNAKVYLDQHETAISYADQVIKVGRFCQKLVSKKLTTLKTKNDEREMFENLLESQNSLIIKGFQAKGQIYNHLEKYPESIFEYNQAKILTENLYGTKNEIFRDIIQKIQHVNSLIKDNSYQMKTTSKKSSQRRFDAYSEDLVDIRSQEASMKFEDVEDFDDQHAHKSIMLETKMSSIPKAAKYDDDENLDISLFDHEEDEQQEDKSNKTFNHRARKLKVSSTVKRKKNKTAKAVKRPESSTLNLKKNLKETEIKSTSSTSFRESHQIYDSCANINTSHQYSHMKQELGYTNPVLGNKTFALKKPGYPTSNLTPPESFYHILNQNKYNKFKAVRGTTPGRQKKSVKKITRIAVKKQVQKTQVEDVRIQTNTHQQKMKVVIDEMHKLQEQIRTSESHEYQERIKILLQQSQDQQEDLLKSIQAQKQRLVEQQRLDLIQEKKLRQEIQRNKQMKKEQKSVCKCGDFRCEKCNPPPPTTAEYGPPVYDPNFKCWTYPYASINHNSEASDKKLIIDDKGSSQSQSPSKDDQFKQYSNLHVEPELSPEDQVFMEMINGIWNRFDTDDNGFLDKRETKMFIKELLHADGLKQLYFIFDDVFDSIDQNKSGTIDKMEMIKFIKAINKMAKENAAKNEHDVHDPILDIVDKTWDQYDSDMNGTLDRNEANVLLRDIFKFMGFDINRITQQDYDRAFESLDLNNSGKITKREWYIFVKAQIEKRKLILAIEEEQSRKREMEVQVDYVPSPRPEIPKASAATMVEFNSNAQIQADIEAVQVPKKSIQLQAGVPMIERQHDAARMVQRVYKRLINFRRMFTYRSLKGVLYSRKYTIDQKSGSLQIMSMHMLHNYIDQTCVNLKLTIFDYVTKKFVYSGTYDHLADVQKFNVFSLQRLAESSLKVLEFERPPFGQHIALLQSIIDKNKFNAGNTNSKGYVDIDFTPQFIQSEESESSSSSDSSSSSSSYSSDEVAPPIQQVQVKEAAAPERPSTPPPIIIEIPPPKPKETSTIGTDMVSELIPRKQPVLRRTGLWALYFIMLHVKMWLARRRVLRRNQLLCASSYRLRSKRSGVRLYKVELHKITERLDLACQDKLQGVEVYYRLIAQETRPSRYKPRDSWYQIYETIYKNLQLPGEEEGDGALMSRYFQKALRMELDEETDHVGVLKLLRKYIDPVEVFDSGLTEPVYSYEIPTPLKKPSEPIGEFEKERFEFEPRGHPGQKLVCRVIKRIRWANINQTKKYKDWKIQVELLDNPHIFDYVVMFKRCKVCMDQEYIRKNLEVEFNPLTSPATIKYIRLKVDDEAYQQKDKNKLYVRSQMWLDHQLFKEQDYDFGASEEFSQDLMKVHFVQQSLPTPEIIEKKEECKTPLFEIKIHSVQHGEPLSADKVITYSNQGYQRHVQEKMASWFPPKDVYSSTPDSEDYDYDWVWEQKYLDDIQRDEYTTSRSYILMETRNVQKSKQNQQIMFYHHKAEEWLSSQKSFQYLASDIKIEIDKDNQLDIRVGAKEPSDSSQQVYMTQDVQREENQDYACTVYNFKNTPLGMYVFEAIHILKPMERAYLLMESLGGLTDEELFHYVDENLGIAHMEREGPKKKNDTKLIEKIVLAMEPAVFKIKFNQSKASQVFMKLMQGYLTRQKYGGQLKKTVTHKAITFDGDLKHISVVYQKLGSKNGFRACIFNLLNKKTRDDCHFIETAVMLGKNDLQQRLQIEWKDSRVISAKILSAEEISKVVKEEEVKEIKPLIVKQVEEVKQVAPPIQRQDSWSSADEYPEKEEILKDIKIMKQFVKALQRKTKAVEGGIETWFRLFDADGSGEIEMREFLRMLEHLKIFIEARQVHMLFQVFDRRGAGCFTRSDFFDILAGVLLINYPKQVIKARNMWEQKQLEDEMCRATHSQNTVVTDPNQPVFVAQRPQATVIEQPKVTTVVAEAPVQPPPKVVEKIPREVKKPKDEDAAPNFDFGPPRQEQYTLNVAKEPLIAAKAPSPPIVQQEPPKMVQSDPVQLIEPPQVAKNPDMPIKAEAPLEKKPTVAQKVEESMKVEAVELPAQIYGKQEKKPDVSQNDLIRVDTQIQKPDVQPDKAPIVQKNIPEIREQSASQFPDFIQAAQPQVEEEKKQAAPEEAKVDEKETLKSFKELYIQYVLTHKKKFNINDLFKEIDKNKGGSVSFTEFHSHFEKLRNTNKVKGIREDPKFDILTKQNMALLFKDINALKDNQTQFDQVTFRQYFYSGEYEKIEGDKDYGYIVTSIEKGKSELVSVEQKQQSVQEEVKVLTADDAAPQSQIISNVPDMSYVTGSDLIRNLFHCMKAKNMNIDQLFEKYDKDKNFLLSAKEFVTIFRQQAQIELSEVEVQNLTKYLRQKVNRTEIQKRELKKIWEEGFQREMFEEHKVKEMINVLTKSGAVVNQDQPQDVLGEPSLSFRQFKIALSQFGNIVNLNMICAYLDQRNAGFIRVKDIADAFGGLDLYSPHPKKEEVVVVAEEPQAETCIEDIIKSFNYYLQNNTPIQSIIAEKRLFLNNKLLPCAKLREIIEEKLKITFTNQDRQVLLKYIQDRFGRKELKKAELQELLDTKFKRSYNAQAAQDAIRKTMDLGIKNEVYKTQNLMEFKRLLYPYVSQYAKDQPTLNSICTNLTNYMDRDENGQITEQDLRSAFDVLGSYNPEKQVEVVQTDPVIVNWFDIICPLREHIEGTKSSPDKIFEQYDKDKSFLLDAAEVHRMVKSLININLKPHELQIIPNAMRGLTGRNGVRKAEFAHLLNNWWDPCLKGKAVDAQNDKPRAFDKDLAKQTLEKLVKHFGTRKQFKDTFKPEAYQINRASFGEKKGDRIFFTMYSFKHFLYDSGIKDLDEIANFTCSHYNKYGQVMFGADDIFGEDEEYDNDFE